MGLTIDVLVTCDRCQKKEHLQVSLGTSERNVPGPSGWWKDGATGSMRACGEECRDFLAKNSPRFRSACKA
jgi:hypothetical protein